MPFTPKDWRDATGHDGGGDTSTPLTAAALEDLETRLAAYTDSFNLVGGIYTPTLTNTTNIAASTPYSSHYIRIGNQVSVSGSADIDATATGVIVLGISIPIASNFGSFVDAWGPSSTQFDVGTGLVSADAANNRVTLDATTSTTANTGWAWQFTYTVI
jgi:hypothetical protein